MRDKSHFLVLHKLEPKPNKYCLGYIVYFHYVRHHPAMNKCSALVMQRALTVSKSSMRKRKTDRNFHEQNNSQHTNTKSFLCLDNGHGFEKTVGVGTDFEVSTRDHYDS